MSDFIDKDDNEKNNGSVPDAGNGGGASSGSSSGAGGASGAGTGDGSTPSGGARTGNAGSATNGSGTAGAAGGNDASAMIKTADGGLLMFKPLEDIIHQSMIPYAEYVILDRALPRVEDGLKPVQRRILYTMQQLDTSPLSPYRKSARIVGDCLGKFHPHGDSSIYGAMVRMAQQHNSRLKLVDGHGNFGSVDGDSAAAMRYTEVRLMPIAMELLRDLEKDTVSWSLNFDDTMKEPNVLPGRFPNLLVNGATGIAVGLATNIPPHNLGEIIDGTIAFIDNPRISLNQMMRIIKGPDFPTGGFVLTGCELEKAYETGKGKIHMRAKISIEVAENEKRNIVISELPYQVNKSSLLQRILDLREEKKGALIGISEICDESDRDGMRAVIRIKRDADAKAILDILFKATDLECTFGINMVAIADGKPQLMGLLDIIRYYVDFQRDVIFRRTKFELNEARDREHILEGLVIAVANIDEVIALIKKSSSPSEARTALRERFILSERQAQAILDMRLARLTNLEVNKLKAELSELRIKIARLLIILNSRKEQMLVVKEELAAIKKEFKEPRRSIIVTTAADAVIPSSDDEKPIENFSVVVNANEHIKRVPEKNFSMSVKTISEKAGLNEVAPILIETQNDNTLYCFTNLGNCHKIDVDSLPECKWREKGIRLSKLIKSCPEQERVAAIFPIGDMLPRGHIMFYTKHGMVKKSPWTEYGVVKSNFQAVKLRDGDEVIGVEHFNQDNTLLFVTASGSCLNIDKSDIPEQGRVASGVKGIMLADDDYVVFASQIYNEGEIIVVTDNGYLKRVISAEFDVMARYRKGVKIIDLKGDNGKNVLFCSYVTVPYEIVLTNDADESITVPSESISIEARTHKGKPLKGFKGGLKVRAAYRHRTEGEYVTVHTKRKPAQK
jgi:DNA gyrase subunit A